MNHINEEIPHPEMWRMSLRIDSDSVQYSIYSIVEDGSLKFQSLVLPKSGESYLKRLETLIYDTPLLLKDYKSVDILINTSQFVIVPQDLATEESDFESAFRFLYPQFGGEVLHNNLKQCNATLVFGVEKNVLAFIQRTFYQCSIRHTLSPLCQYFGKKSMLGNVSKLYVHVQGDQLDMCAFNRKGLALANSFKFRHINDAIFYILGVWNVHGLDAMNDELQIVGDKELKKNLIPELRKFITFVMPAIFPSALFKLGNGAIDAPFDLIILPVICE